MFSFFLPIYDMFLFCLRPVYRQQYPVMIYRGNIHKSGFCASADSIQESQTPSPATTPQEHHTHRQANVQAHELFHPHVPLLHGHDKRWAEPRPSCGCMCSTRKIRRARQRPKPFCCSCCSREAASLAPFRDEHEHLAGSDLDNKVVVEGKSKLALPPDVVEREKA